jgi:hypothetical protein
MMRRLREAALTGTLVAGSVLVRAHSGPPFPILTDYRTGAYVVSIWTDPDTTDDGSPGGQFWVRLHPAVGPSGIPQDTHVAIVIAPIQRSATERAAPAAPVRGDPTNQFAALPIDHEGRFAVRVTIDGPLGTATANAIVDATYDLRPPRALLALYLAPFLLVGLLWGRLLMRRRRA